RQRRPGPWHPRRRRRHHRAHRAGQPGRRAPGARAGRLRPLPVASLVALASMTSKVRVLIVDDDPLVRGALTTILRSSPDLEVVGEASDGTQVSAAVDACAPDVVLMDIRMPKLDGLAATELLRGRPNPPEVIVLTTFHADEHVLRALRAGASGF